MAEIPAAFQDLLTEKKAIANLATLMPDGSPQVTPVWFDYSNGRIRVNTAKGRVKARNMAEGSRVALSILDPDNAYRYLQVRGKVVHVTEAGARTYRQPGEEVSRQGRVSLAQREGCAGDLRNRAGVRASDGVIRGRRDNPWRQSRHASAPIAPLPRHSLGNRRTDAPSIPPKAATAIRVPRAMRDQPAGPRDRASG